MADLARVFEEDSQEYANLHSREGSIARDEKLLQWLLFQLDEEQLLDLNRPHTPTMAHSGEMFVDWYRDVAAVRILYKERKYRLCAALCDELLLTMSHPVYRLFLYFYQAVCYESLGDAVQANSRSKIVLWAQARTALIAAGEMCDDAKAVMGLDGGLLGGMTPGYVKLELLDEYGFDSPSSYAALSPEGLFGLAVNIADQNARGQIFGCDKTLRLDKNSPGSLFKTPVRQGYQRRAHDLSLASTKGPSKKRSVHKVRLSQSLSLDHQLADHLVPSPLFSRHSSTISQAVSSVLPSSPTPSQSLAVYKPLPPRPQDRPLPALPLQAQSHFITTGDKIVLRPRRTTALATLIAKYEAREKVYTTPRNLDVYKISSEDEIEEEDEEEEENSRGRQRTRLEERNPLFDEMAATPLTQRYNRISDIFVPKPSSCEKSDTMFEVYTDRFDERLVGDAERVSALHGKDDDRISAERRSHSDLPHDISDKENWTVTEYTDHVSATTPRPVSVPPLRLSLTPTATATPHHLTLQTPTQPGHIDRTYNHLPIPSASPATITPKHRPTTTPPQLPAQHTVLTTLFTQSLHALTTQISALESATTVSKPQPQLFCNDSSKKRNDKAARISELKARGWKGINAKSKGFKGREYFDWFVGEVERELEVDARG